MIRGCDSLQITYQGQPITGFSSAATFDSDLIDVSNYIELIAFIYISAESGTSPTLDCKLQYSPDKTNWVDSGDAFTQMTTSTGLFLKKASANFGKYARLVFTVGGTTPSYTFTPTLMGKQ